MDLNWHRGHELVRYGISPSFFQPAGKIVDNESRYYRNDWWDLSVKGSVTLPSLDWIFNSENFPEWFFYVNPIIFALNNNSLKIVPRICSIAFAFQQVCKGFILAANGSQKELTQEVTFNLFINCNKWKTHQFT